MNNINNDAKQLFVIFTYLKAYEKSVEDYLINRNWGIKKEGYLLNLKDYEYIKRIICYDNLMNISEQYQLDQKFNELGYLNILSKIKEISPIKVNTTEELINLIKGKNEYILIDKQILDAIQINQQKDYQFEVKYFILELKIGKDSIKFYNNKYILNESTYKICNENETLTKISKAIIEYYNFEKMIKNQKEKKDKDKERVYLVNKKDIDEWKEFTNYKNIKNNLLKYQFEYVKYEINKEILMLYKDNMPYMKPIKSIKFKSNKELEDYIKENSLVIINQKFYDLVNGDKGKEENIYFTVINNLVTIYIGRKEVKFHSNNNVLYSVKESYIRILLKIFFFQEELNINIQMPIDENINIKIGLVQKDWIKQFKSHFEYDYLKVLINSCEKIKEYNYSSLSDDKLDNLINNILNDYKNTIDKEHKLEKLNFGKEKQLILSEKEIKKPKLKYYNDFEIVSSDIIAALQILFQNYSSSFLDIKNCIIGNHKILILFQDSKGNDYYEIGKINNSTFKAEYLLDFNQKIEKKNFFKILYENDYEDFVNNIYNNNLSNSFPINANLECSSYKIDIEHNEKKNNQNKDNSLIDKVKNTLSSIYLFEKKLNYKLEKSNDKLSDKKNLYFYKDCYLINSKLLSEFKNLFLYDLLIQQINSQQNYIPGIEKTIIENFFLLKNESYSLLLNQNNNFTINFDEFGKISQKKIKIKKNEFSFYEDLAIVNEEIYLFLNEFAKINKKKIEAHKIFIIINNEKIIFKHSNSKLSYILAYQKNENNSFEAEIIVHFLQDKFLDEYYLKLNEQRIDDIFPDKLIDLIYNNNDQIIGNLNLLKNYQNEPQEKDYFYKQYLEILIQFYIENKKFMELVGNKIEDIGGGNEKELYILNRHWIDEFKYIFEYEEIYKILDSNQKILLNNDDIKIKIEYISNKISNEMKSHLNNLKEEIISKKLSNQKLDEIISYKCSFKDTNNSFNFFPKLMIIQQKYLELLIAKHLIIREKKKIKYLFGDKKIALLVKVKNEDIIEIGYVDEYNIFIPEIIISSEKNVDTIFNLYKNKGMNYIRELMNQNKVENFGKVKCLKIKEIISEKEIKISNINSISNTLRTLLILFINQHKLQNLSNTLDENCDINQKFEEAFLIDLSFLYQFEYDRIKDTIIKNSSIISKLKKFSSLSEEDLLNIIFKDLDLKILNEIDNNIKQFEMYNNINGNGFIKNPEKAIISTEKKINIYNNFIIANKSVMNILTTNFNIFTKFDIVKYISYNRKIFIMIDYGNQYSLLSGSIINDENIFKLEYIFDFKSKENLRMKYTNEIKEIILNYDTYIKDLNNKNIYQNDYIFPVYNKDNTK